MKQKLFLAIIVCAISVSCGNKSGVKDGKITTDLVDPENPPVITFKETQYDFGTISQGEIIKYTFTFTNTGGSSLVIQDVKPTCGCTVPKEWPTYPVKPGEGGKIVVQFDSAGKQGKISKSIRVVANTKPNVNVIKLVGYINAPNMKQ